MRGNRRAIAWRFSRIRSELCYNDVRNKA